MQAPTGMEIIKICPENYNEILEKTKDHQKPVTLDELKKSYISANECNKIAFMMIMSPMFWEKNGEETSPPD
jgi:hypothetical protein